MFEIQQSNVDFRYDLMHTVQIVAVLEKSLASGWFLLVRSAVSGNKMLCTFLDPNLIFLTISSHKAVKIITKFIFSILGIQLRRSTFFSRLVCSSGLTVTANNLLKQPNQSKLSRDSCSLTLKVTRTLFSRNVFEGVKTRRHKAFDSVTGAGNLRHACHTWHAEAPSFTCRFLSWFAKKVYWHWLV